eukprot:c10703_g2_i2.p1 GENE.c10703_g2_i2~~c10703_g2_i2.p1  ORF type:complete len:362 (+),score=73.67 c10703_g2_i2:133-1218(+)
MVNYQKLLQETYWSEEELDALHRRFKKVSGGAKVISEEQFLFALGRPGSFIGRRLYTVFKRQCAGREVDGLDFEAYASGLSSFCPNASLHEKMFVCFKTFDLDDQNCIAPQNLHDIIGAIMKEVNIIISEQQIASLVTRTMAQASTNPAGAIEFPAFQVIFIRCHGLLAAFTIETWQLVDSVPNSARVSMFVKHSLRKNTSSQSFHDHDHDHDPLHPNGATDDVELKNPALRKWYNHSIRSAPNTPPKSFTPSHRETHDLLSKAASAISVHQHRHSHHRKSGQIQAVFLMPIDADDAKRCGSGASSSVSTKQTSPVDTARYDDHHETAKSAPVSPINSPRPSLKLLLDNVFAPLSSSKKSK